MNQQKSILFVYPHADPFDPTGSGGQNRLYNLIQEVKQSHYVRVVAPESVVKGERPGEFSSYRQRSLGFLSDVDPGLATVLHKEIRQNDPDVIHVPYPSGIVLSKVISEINRREPSILLDAHDVMSERATQFSNENLGLFSDITRRYYTPVLESVATEVSDHIITVSEKDKKLMTRLNGVSPRKQTVIPNGAHPVELENLDEPEVVRKNLGLSSDSIAVVFLGNCKTGTHNLEAAEYICQHLAPAFGADVEFFIIGKGAPQSDQENVTTLGFVEDLYSTLYAMDIAIAPLQSGTATKLKMFDYMSVQLPIVATHKGTEGIDLKENKHVLISELVERDFEAEIERLVQNPQLREQLGKSSRSLVESEYNWNSIGKRLERVYQRL
jgi:glycosyltransferase involved in cell wall biosynthesis